MCLSDLLNVLLEINEEVFIVSDGRANGNNNICYGRFKQVN